MKRGLLFAPALVCAAISFLALLATVQQGLSWPYCAFYLILPGCFVLMAAAMIRMGHDISRLRRRLGALEGKTRPEGRTTTLTSANDTSETEADLDAPTGTSQPSSGGAPPSGH